MAQRHQAKRENAAAEYKGSHAPISASWSFSPAASCSSWEILAAKSLDVSFGSAAFFALFFFAMEVDDISRFCVGYCRHHVFGDSIHGGLVRRPEAENLRQMGGIQSRM